MSNEQLPEPWLRGTLGDLPAVPRAILHALELASEDLHHWCGDLRDDELHQRPANLASVAFHLRHISRSLDRLLTYAEGGNLCAPQLAALKSEMDGRGSRGELFAELDGALERSAQRIRAFSISQYERGQAIGKKSLPTTVGGLLVHLADHTQRHVGQAITTAKLVVAGRESTPPAAPRSQS